MYDNPIESALWQSAFANFNFLQLDSVSVMGNRISCLSSHTIVFVTIFSLLFMCAIEFISKSEEYKRKFMVSFVFRNILTATLLFKLFSDKVKISFSSYSFFIHCIFYKLLSRHFHFTMECLEYVTLHTFINDIHDEE